VTLKSREQREGAETIEGDQQEEGNTSNDVSRGPDLHNVGSIFR
jgi:hypothetical protein